MIVRIVSYLPDFGNFVMKSIAIVWNGSPFTGAMGNIVGFKGWGILLVSRDGEYCWFQGMGVNFVGLTSRASLDVLFGILFHIWPPEVAFHELVRIANSGVSS